MYPSKWFFPDGVPSEASASGPLQSFREYLDRQDASKTPTAEKDDPDAPLLDLEQPNTSAQDELLNEALRYVPLTKILELKKKQMRAASPLYSGTIYRRTFAWTAFVVYLLSIYAVVYYSVYYIAGSSTHIATKLSSSVLDAYIGVADAYQHAMNPPNTQEVADLMTELYELLADMGYYDHSLIAQPPHISPEINKTLANKLGMSQAAINMMESLPYLNINNNQGVFNWDAGSYGHEFILYSLFADLRIDADLISSRDPYGLTYSNGGDEAPYIDADHFPLSITGEEGAILLVDAKTTQMWTFAMMGSMDPDTANLPDSGEEGFSPTQYPSRLAKDALRSYIDRFKTLEWMPGGDYNGSYQGDELASLYLANGWGSSSFNVSAFKASRIQWFLDDEKRAEAEKPFDRIVNLDRNIGYARNNIQRCEKEIMAIDAGEADRKKYPDMEKHREEQVEKLKGAEKWLPELLAELVLAREVVEGLDPAVRRVREERIKKYGF